MHLLSGTIAESGKVVDKIELKNELLQRTIIALNEMTFFLSRSCHVTFICISIATLSDNKYMNRVWL